MNYRTKLSMLLVAPCRCQKQLPNDHITTFPPLYHRNTYHRASETLGAASKYFLHPLE
jgi:hypothetical protein